MFYLLFYSISVLTYWPLGSFFHCIYFLVTNCVFLLMELVLVAGLIQPCLTFLLPATKCDGTHGWVHSWRAPVSFGTSRWVSWMKDIRTIRINCSNRCGCVENRWRFQLNKSTIFLWGDKHFLIQSPIRMNRVPGRPINTGGFVVTL
jgi:hypothetical protein